MSIKREEVSTLYRTYSPTINQYFNIGDGRDGYICYNNGGFWRNNIPPGTPFESKDFSTNIKYRTLNGFHPPAPFKYLSDGRGRDTYILKNYGGLIYQTKPIKSFHLKDFLRTPSDCILNYNHPSSKFGKRRFVSRDEYRINKILQNNERGIINRLYNNEKYKFIPGLTKENIRERISPVRNNKYNKCLTTTDPNLIYNVDKISSYNYKKKINKLMEPTNDYLHFKNDKVKTVKDQIYCKTYYK